jgi:hypothetical protein
VIDDEQWQVASEIEQSHPSWLVMWGCYSRMFWAFPLFTVPPGTIVSAPGPDRLLADMEDVENEQSGPWEPVYAEGIRGWPGSYSGYSVDRPDWHWGPDPSYRS